MVMKKEEKNLKDLVEENYLDKLVEYIIFHLAMQLRLRIVANSPMRAFTSKELMAKIDLEIKEVLKKFQPTSTQLEIINNLSSESKQYFLITLGEDPNDLSQKRLIKLFQNKFGYALFKNKIFYIDSNCNIFSFKPELYNGTDLIDFFPKEINQIKEASEMGLFCFRAYLNHYPGNLGKFYLNTVGSLTKVDNNCTVSTGIKTTKILGVFFNALIQKPGINTPLKLDSYEFYSAFFGDKPGGLTFDTLKGLESKRKKQVLSIFCEALIQIATNEQVNSLTRELRQQDNHTIKQLCSPRLIQSFFTNHSSTDSYKEYEKTLYFSSRFVKGSLLKCIFSTKYDKEIPIEVCELIAESLYKKDYKNLLLVNKATGSAAKVEEERFTKQFGRRF